MRLLLPALALIVLCPAFAETYRERLMSDQPAAYWRFDEIQQCCTPNETHESMRADAGANVSLLEPGPRPPVFPLFTAENTAADFTHFSKDTFLRVKDPGALSVFDFTQGQAITLEAWVRCLKLGDGQNVYIVGKGRTGASGPAATNQNWALRLRGMKAGNETVACASFLFHDDVNAGEQGWHRFTSTRGFAPGQEWHHVAASYVFGKPESAKVYINGEEIPGVWDMGGATTTAPIVDDDEVWIGGSMGGSASAQFPGQIDEVAIYRTLLSVDRIKLHAMREGPAPALKQAQRPVATKAAAKPELPPAPVAAIDPATLPAGKVRVEIFEFPVATEGLTAEVFGDEAMKKKDDGGADPAWAKLPPLRSEQFIEPNFALASLPNKYSTRGVKTDRSRPFLVRMAAAVSLPPGQHTVHLRALTGTRVAWDTQVIAQTPLKRANYGDAEPVPDQHALQLVKEMPLLPPGHREVQAAIQSDGKPHVLVLETWVGGKSVRPELGQVSLWVKSGEQWSVLAPSFDERLEIAAADRAMREQADRITALNAQRRRIPDEEAYWKKRHALAREHAKAAPAVPSNGARTPVDAFIAEKLTKAGAKAAPLADDAAFLRRVSLDTIGLIPTPEEADAFLADPAPDKRARAIDRLLNDPRWADHWTSYWQDVLAENPNILKGTLNNTGPFRWWIHESLADNKPMDRFATEIISMEGSPNYGGPAGFAIASQNDLPMAAKAQVLASAFLANEMKCARCHDAVHHTFEQKELFQIAALLQRAPLKVPETSLTKGLSKNSHVTVTLKAGEVIQPHFPFSSVKEPLPGVIRQSGDSREMFAAILTDPRNDRFARVLVNRLWKQFLGFGIVEPVDDWETSLPSHPELLQWLAAEFITHGYDLKHVARLILNSDAYQRVPTAEAMAEVKSSDRLFAAQARRRLTAEQLLDSLMHAAGQEYDTELLTFDPEGRQRAADQANLGVPRRAWEFAALSNERDRPALAKPRAQIFTDVLAAFGWRESRPEPRSTRDHDANVIQPALLANGTLGTLISRVHDGNAFTELALKEQPLEAFVRQLYLRALTRVPTPEETKRVSAVLAEGYESRLTGAPAAPPMPASTKGVSWANHLNPDATTAVLEAERGVKAGPAPSPRLTSDWRDRYEDVLWGLMISPEMVWVP